MTNVEFGRKHHPTDRAHQFRADGRCVGWEEYVRGDGMGEVVEIHRDKVRDYGLSPTDVLPRGRRLSMDPARHAGPTVRFQLEKVCPHWDPRRNGKGAGKGYLFLLTLGTPLRGVGSKGEMVPFETNGAFWWADVAVEKLGKPGEKVSCVVLDTVGGMDAVGIEKEEFLMAKGRKGMSWAGVTHWDLV